MKSNRYEIYTDGSSRKGGKVGGWAIVVYKDGELIDVLYDNNVQDTTNNRMEITGLLKALAWTTENTYPCDTVIIYSDSTYTVKLFNEWVQQMERRGWKKADGKTTPENLDLLKELSKYADIGFRNFIVAKIPGHAGVEGNVLADALCTGNYRKIKGDLPLIFLINKGN